MRLLLRSDLMQHQGVPKEYDLDLNPFGEAADALTKNSFVFSEQDLPGFKAKNKARAEATAAGIPAHLLRQKDRVEKPAQNQGHGHGHGRRGRQEYYRKAIPSSSPLVTHSARWRRPANSEQRKQPCMAALSTRSTAFRLRPPNPTTS